MEADRGETMELYLVQHGAAKSETEDPERRLTDAGRRSVERTASFLESLHISVDHIEHSGKPRARQTAEILAARLHPVGGIHEVGGIAPNDDVEPMRSRLENESQELMIVGHLPYLSRLLARLLDLDADHAVVTFQMGGLVRVDRDDLKSLTRPIGCRGRWGVRWVLPPELTGSP
jgi:phosphohistidine phosphatase